MAYKFQLGPSRLSGSLNVIGDLSSSLSGAGVTTNISASGDLRAGGLRLARLTGSTTFDAVGSDQILFASSEAGQVDGITPSNFAGVLAGTVTTTGIEDSSGVLNVSIDGLTAASIATGDLIMFDDSAGGTLRSETMDDLFTLGPPLASAGVINVGTDSILFLDADDSNSAKKESVEDFATGLAGPGLAATGGALEVTAGSLIDITSDAVAVDLTEAAAATLADGDFLVFLSGGTAGAASKGDTSDLADLLGGAGLAVTNSTLAVVNATNGGLSVAANDVTVDLNDLSAAAVTVADDSIAIIDASATNGSRKESIADLASAMAGTGVTATNGVFSVDTTGGDSMSSTAAIDNTVLTAGLNYFTGTIDPSAEFVEVILPSGDSNEPTAGDVFYLKAPSNCGTGNRVNIEVSGSHLIDGETSIVLQDSYATVGFVYAASASWAIV